MWNRKKYNAMLTNIAEKRQFKGCYVKNKEALYCLLSEKLFVSYDTVKGWTRAKSNGPGERRILEKLEELLETKLTVDDVAQKEERERQITNYSDFVKSNIKKCYDLMMDYLNSDYYEEEDVYCKMRAEMRKYRIGIPENLFAKIEECADMYLDPIIYDHANFFAELYTEDMGYFDEEGIFHLKDEASTLKHLGLFLEKMTSIQNEIENFAMRELYPILVQ